MNLKESLKYFKKIKTFNDIYQITEDLTKKEKDDLFEIFTYFLFQLHPALNHDLVSVWLYNNIPNKILKKLNIPEKDKGIDLIVEKP